MNAHCERIIGSIRREVLDHVLLMGQAHARQVLAAYEIHYNTHRPHQARKLLRTQILGGLLNEYRYAL